MNETLSPETEALGCQVSLNQPVQPCALSKALSPPDFPTASHCGLRAICSILHTFGKYFKARALPSAVLNGLRRRPSEEQRIGLLPSGAIENSPGQARRSPGGRGKERVALPGRADRTLAPRIAQSRDGAGLSHRPSGAGIPRPNAFPGFHPGLFSTLPSGRNRAGCLAAPPFRIAGCRLHRYASNPASSKSRPITLSRSKNKG
jgi:hypothetical protein